MEDGQGQFVFHFSLSGDPEPMLCTLGYFVEPPFDVPYSGACDLAFDEFVGNLAHQLGGAYNLVKVVQEVKAFGAVAVAESTTAPAPFALGGTVLPSNTALLVRKVTGASGRGRSGRFYLPGVPESAADAGGVLSEAYFTAMQEEVQNFLTSWHEGPDLPDMALNHGPTTGGGASRLTGLTLDPLCATQRRRMRP